MRDTAYPCSVRKRQKSHGKLSKLLDIVAEKPRLRRAPPADASRLIKQGYRYCSAHQNKSTVQLKSRPHGGSLLRGIKACTYVVIAFTLGRHCACALHHGTTLAEVLLNRVADGISRPYHPDAWARIAFKGGTRLPGYARRRVVRASSRISSSIASTPSHPRAGSYGLARAFNRSH